MTIGKKGATAASIIITIFIIVLALPQLTTPVIITAAYGQFSNPGPISPLAPAITTAAIEDNMTRMISELNQTTGEWKARNIMVNEDADTGQFTIVMLSTNQSTGWVENRLSNTTQTYGFDLLLYDLFHDKWLTVVLISPQPEQIATTTTTTPPLTPTTPTIPPQAQMATVEGEEETTTEEENDNDEQEEDTATDNNDDDDNDNNNNNSRDGPLDDLVEPIDRLFDEDPNNDPEVDNEVTREFDELFGEGE
jgi:hypothetical protein